MSAQLTLEGAPTVTAADIVRALYAHYRPEASQWLCFDELRIGTGYGKGADQRLDFWALHAWPSEHFRRVAYEIKVSRADFLAELKQPRKRAYALLVSNEFYFAAPAGMIRAAELPPECGLAEYRDHGDGHTTVWFAVAAPLRDTPPPSWRFMASALRRAAKGAGR